jgi:hypothetical protein
MNLERSERFETPDRKSFKDLAIKLSVSLQDLPSRRNKDSGVPRVGQVNASARANAINEAEILVMMDDPEKPSKDILDLRQLKIAEVRSRLQKIRYSNDDDQGFVEKALQALDELEKAQ